MSKRRQRRKPAKPRRPLPTKNASPANAFEHDYARACGLAESGAYDQARAAYLTLATKDLSVDLKAVIENDLGLLDALAGDATAARARFERAISIDLTCTSAQQNLRQLDLSCRIDGVQQASDAPPASVEQPARPRRPRIAIVSLLFNWPSTGGGTVHTAETGKFLHRAGYEVRHFYAQYAEWEVGNVRQPLETAAEALVFDASSWNAAELKRRFRAAVDQFAPDYVIITDSWNSKPLLAEAMQGYRYFLRLAALECLCPLNNVRLLVDSQGQIASCPKHQLATADVCRQCVGQRARFSGNLHQAERCLAGYGTPEYDALLRRAFAEAEGVLVVNPMIATMVSPHAKAVHVVPSGFDPERFPWPWPDDAQTLTAKSRMQIFFAGLVEESMKGFHVVHEACRRLWDVRQDFELVATAEPIGQNDPFTRYIGWQSQEEIPRRLHEADMLVFPTVAEEALGRSAVEAMGVGRPVIASRIGGLLYTVTDGLTGLLCEPGNVADLAAKITLLLDDPALRRRLGDAGRKKFEEEYTWDVIVNRHYKRLMPALPDVNRIATPAPLATASHGNRANSTTAGYAPQIRPRVDHSLLVTAAATFFGLKSVDVSRMWDTYRQFSERQGYAGKLGEWKTLSTEEAFLLCLAMSLTRPRVIVELGTQYGKSTRRLVDLADFLGLDSRIISYDVVDELEYVGRDEIDFHLQDLTGAFRTEVLDKFGSGLVFSDAHPYALLSEVVRETSSHYGNWMLAVHDCGPGLCNPHMPISREDPAITGNTGLWERHILAEVFGIDDPLSPALDSQSTATRRMQVFETQHGMALIAPAGRSGPSGGPPPIDPAGAVLSI